MATLLDIRTAMKISDEKVSEVAYDLSIQFPELSQNDAWLKAEVFLVDKCLNSIGPYILSKITKTTI